MTGMAQGFVLYYQPCNAQNGIRMLELKFNQFGSISPKSWANWVFLGDVFHSKAKAFSGNHLVLPEVLRSFLKSEDSCCTLLHHVFGKGCWRRMNHMSWCSNFLKSFLFRNTSLMPETINYESMPMFSWWTLNDRLFPQQHRFDSLVTPFVVKFPSITP